MNKVDVIKVLAEDKTFENEIKNKGDNDLEVKIKILQKEVDTLKAIINLKEIELTSKDEKIKEVKDDNKKLAKQIEDLEKEAKEMLLYP
jgi:septal ring factor EnvC (AmiA/AmiB activator)|tara:strand:+ start:310 stop:576 length:267 start_codon:yes stop_codon:yes gene_type:complete